MRKYAYNTRTYLVREYTGEIINKIEENEDILKEIINYEKDEENGTITKSITKLVGIKRNGQLNIFAE